jgi:hypothetical protein
VTHPRPTPTQRATPGSIGPYHNYNVTKWLEPGLATIVTVLGIALTTVGALVHAAQAVAPGALLTLVGAAWLGNALARREVRLFPGGTQS